MNILITGSSGFIANHLIFKLSKNLNSHIYGFDLDNSKNTNFIYDVRNKINIDKLPNRIDLIINLAFLKINGYTEEVLIKRIIK